MGDSEHRLDRRGFLRDGAAAVLGAGALGLSGTPALAGPTEPRIRGHATLGRTGLSVSDISFGSSRMTDPDLVRHALDRGIDYFDTAEDYRGGRSEEAIGQALRGVRDRVTITSKTMAGAGETRAVLRRQAGPHRSGPSGRPRRVGEDPDYRQGNPARISGGHVRGPVGHLRPPRNR